VARILIAASSLLALVTFTESAAAQSGMSASCRRAYAQYSNSPGPKAFAHANNDACGFGYAQTIQRARNLAIGYCRQYGGHGCRIREDIY
jgi:hypothetical protein